MVDLDTNVSSVVLLHARTGQQIWRTDTAFVAANSGWITQGATERGPAVFAGTAQSILAFRLSDGKQLWEHTFPPQQVPAHSTYFQGLVLFTCENGINSTAITALDANTGAVQWTTPDIAYTILWATTSNVFVYCSYDKNRANNSRIGPVARDRNGKLVWSHYNETSTDLNNNPNFVAGSSNNIYMYSKPAQNNPLMTMIEADTGNEKWALPLPDFAPGPVDDYDQYAWDSRLFRLICVNKTTFMVQAISEAKVTLWTSFFPSTDPNWILLVGGGTVLIFGQTVNEIRALDANHGGAMWVLGGVDQPQDGAVAEDGLMFYGDGHGYFYAIQL